MWEGGREPGWWEGGREVGGWVAGGREGRGGGVVPRDLFRGPDAPPPSVRRKIISTFLHTFIRLLKFIFFKLGLIIAYNLSLLPKFISVFYNHIFVIVFIVIGGFSFY